MKRQEGAFKALAPTGANLLHYAETDPSRCTRHHPNAGRDHCLKRVDRRSEYTQTDWLQVEHRCKLFATCRTF